MSRSLKESYSTVHTQVQKLMSIYKKELLTLEQDRVKRVEAGRKAYVTALEKVYV